MSVLCKNWSPHLCSVYPKTSREARSLIFPRMQNLLQISFFPRDELSPVITGSRLIGQLFIESRLHMEFTAHLAIADLVDMRRFQLCVNQFGCVLAHITQQSIYVGRLRLLIHLSLVVSWYIIRREFYHLGLVTRLEVLHAIATIEFGNFRYYKSIGQSCCSKCENWTASTSVNTATW